MVVKEMRRYSLHQSGLNNLFLVTFVFGQAVCIRLEGLMDEVANGDVFCH